MKSVKAASLLKKMKSPVFLKSICFLMFFSAIISCRPYLGFDRTKHPDPPDYTSEQSWIALPWRYDRGDYVPWNCSSAENQEEARVDVFYVHPTVASGGSSWNADVKSKRFNKRCEKYTMYQATAFNACARVYAPRYRHAVLKAFFREEKGKEPLDLAYEDIKKAFEHYLQHWNNGRPIILAGHSQGAWHIMRLMKDFFDGKELQKKLVVAYPIGMYFKKDELMYIPLGADEKQTGCYVTWNTFRWNTKASYGKGYYANAPCVNPLTMKADETYASAALNKGSVSYKRFSVDGEVCDAQMQGGQLWIHRPKKKGYYSMHKTYHLWDFHLFYMNLRENATKRVEAYLKENK
jgi:hypothetical protein